MIPLRVLLVEDSEDDAALLLRELRKGRYEPVHLRVETKEAMLAALADGEWDMVISDYAMPRFDGLRALQTLHEVDPDMPFLIVSGEIGEETAVALMKAGAHDYIMKSNYARLIPAIDRELREAEMRRARRVAERERQEYAERLHILSQRLLEAQEAERRQIACELHDEIGQALTALKLNLRAMIVDAPSLLLPRMEDSIAAIEQALQQVRDIS